jgi:tripartite-type tricarboxylate transporter receptor subunit TctC
MSKRTKALLLLPAFALLTACGSGGNGSASADGEWAPEGPVTISVGASPGGGSDIFARDFASHYGDATDETVSVENYEAIEGEMKIYSEAGNPEILGVGNYNTMVAHPLELDPGYTWDEFTHLAVVAVDVDYVVSGAGNFDSAEDMLEQASGQTLTFGGVGSGSSHEFTINQLAEAFDVDFQPVAFDGGGDLIRAAMAGDVDLIISSPGEFMPLVESGDVDVLLSTGTEEYRPEELADIPLASELGAETEFPLFWRNLYGPPDLTEEQQAYWVNAIKTWTESDAYEGYIEANALTAEFIAGDELIEFIGSDVNAFQDAKDDG